MSLETPAGAQGDSEIGELIEDATAVAPPEAVGEVMRREQLKEILAGLTHRERSVIELRYGLRDDRPRTLDEVGQRFGLTRERIRQIEARTLAKLQEPRRVAAPARVPRLTFPGAPHATRPTAGGSWRATARRAARLRAAARSFGRTGAESPDTQRGERLARRDRRPCPLLLSRGRPNR